MYKGKRSTLKYGGHTDPDIIIAYSFYLYNEPEVKLQLLAFLISRSLSLGQDWVQIVGKSCSLST